MRQLIKYTLIILGTVSAALLIYQFRTVVVLLVVSLAITAASRPMLTYMGRFRIPGFLAQLLILLVGFSIVIGLAFLIGPVITIESQRLTNHSLIQYNSAYEMWELGDPWKQMIASFLPEPGRLMDYFLGENGELLLPTALNLTQNLAEFFGNLFIVLVFSMYWAQDQDRFNRLLLSFLSPYLRIPMRNAWQTMEQSVGRYLRSELAMGLIAALLLGAGYALLQLPYAAILAILAFVGWFVPLLGFAIILIPVILTTLSGGLWLVGLSVAYTLFVFMGLKYWIEPKYLHSRRYSSFLIVFWIVILGSFLGVSGYLAGPVVAVATQVVWSQYLQYRAGREYDDLRLAGLTQKYAALHERYTAAREQYPSLQLGSLVERLECSLKKTEQLVEEQITNDGSW